MRIKAVIMDGDGSTITHDNVVPDNLKILIRNNPQIKWIMATGRSLELLKKTPIFEYLSPDELHIMDGGSRLTFLNGNCKIKHLINSQYLNILFDQIQLDRVNFLYYSPDGETGYVYSGEENFSSTFKFHEDNVNYTSNIKQFQLWVHEFPPSKILLNSKGPIDLNGLYYHQNENNFDITDNNVNKGQACVKLLQQLNLPPNEVAFVFNDLNDLPVVEHQLLTDMIKIKVGNALPTTISTFHVQTPYEVSSILEKLLS